MQGTDIASTADISLLRFEIVKVQTAVFVFIFVSKSYVTDLTEA